MPHILVLPPQPFLVAKGAATLDLLSGGRFVLSVAAGYQRAEFTALGVDYEQRNELFDEAVEVMRGVWSTDEYAYEGLTFSAADGEPQAEERPDLDRRPAGSSGASGPLATAGARSPPAACPARPRRLASRRRRTWPR